MAEHTVHRSLGAAASWQSELRAQRLAQLQTMTQQDVQALVDEMTSTTHLPRLSMHFKRHGHEFGAATEGAYQQLFREHARLSSLRRFTFLMRADNARMWYLIDEASGSIAAYNESRKRYWSFFRATDVPRLLGRMRGAWVEVVLTEAGWRHQLW